MRLEFRSSSGRSKLENTHVHAADLLPFPRDNRCRMATGTRQTPVAHDTGKTLRQVATIDLPGPVGKRFDYLSTDDEDHYLLSAHLAAGLLYVIDMKTNRLVKAIPDVPGVEGVEYVPEMKKVYTSDWHENRIAVLDLRQMKVIKKIPNRGQAERQHLRCPISEALRIG